MCVMFDECSHCGEWINFEDIIHNDRKTICPKCNAVDSFSWKPLKKGEQVITKEQAEKLNEIITNLQPIQFSELKLKTIL